MINNLFYKFKYFKFNPSYHVGDSGVTVIMAASQAVDPGSTPGCRTEEFFFFQAIVASFSVFNVLFSCYDSISRKIL